MSCFCIKSKSLARCATLQFGAIQTPFVMTLQQKIAMFVRHFGKRLMVWFLRAMRWHARLLAKLLVLAGVVAALIWAGATFWLFPSVDNYRQDVSQLAGD